MTSAALHKGEPIDVAVIGAGPSGLAAATALKAAGLARVVVIERELQAGGIPRHCGHPPFGMREFARVLTGPAYAARIAERARRAGVEIHLATTVVDILPEAELRVTSADGLQHLKARRVICATGVRETSRAARLISGPRQQGVMNTGALQSLVYLKQQRPFRRPVIIGSELVAFSALMSCFHAGIRPQAMVEPGPGAIARWPSQWFPRIKGVEFIPNSRLLEIHGSRQVEGVSLADPEGQLRQIDCDGVVLTGQFTPEAALVRCGHLKLAPATGGPLVDQWGRCSDPSYFATGNLLRPTETAGHCWAEGRKTGQWVAEDLTAGLPVTQNPLQLLCRDSRIKFAMPQLITGTDQAGGMTHVQMRVTEAVSGTLVASLANRPIWQKTIATRPERRIRLPISKLTAQARSGSIELAIQDSLP
ncbi:FAD-dependent oxidoreductase [Pseudophaeobacter sp.]|uniref:NAD(P)/FAD-dependent oxidoreductase n=1 Tax=Pseudophaeobacter sp. TaxID=1971739 RepID=UPI0032988865